MLLIKNNIEPLKQLCLTHNVDTMYLFGSATTSNFNEESDIDLLVKFKKFDLAGYFDNYMSLKLKLKNLLGRDIDLLEEQTLKNPVLINAVNKSKELVYG